MAPAGRHYPKELNPFGDDGSSSQDEVTDPGDYPSHLDPFLDGDDAVNETPEYPEHLDPFLDSDTANSEPAKPDKNKASFTIKEDELDEDGSNPFADDVAEDQQGTKQQDNSQPKQATPSLQKPPRPKEESPSPELSEPPKPLPRTKSLLKKEQAHKKRMQEQQVMITDLHHQATSLQSNTSSSTSTSSTNATETNQPSLNAIGTFQRRKNKRLAPPLPINFKREVSGSLDAIEEELESIGDKLAIIDKESNICQKTLTSTDETVDEAAMKTTRDKFVELIKRRNSIVRRQKELMYKRRELKLDQLHSDIEYELRMIGNKQREYIVITARICVKLESIFLTFFCLPQTPNFNPVSTRTEEDEMREKDLLKKLVEIVEEKNDIVENLNKDSSW